MDLATIINHTDQVQIFLSGFAFFVSVAVFYFIHRMNEYNRLARSLSIFCIFSASWAFFDLLSYLSTVHQLMYFFHVLSIAFVPFVLVQLFEFSFTLFQESRESPPPLSFFLLKAAYYTAAAVLSLLFLFDGLDATHTTIATIVPIAFGSYILSLGVYVPLLIAFFGITILPSVGFYIYALRSESARKRAQGAWLLVSLLGAVVLGELYFILNGPLPLFLAFVPATIIFSLGAGYAVRKGAPMNAKITLVRTINIVIWFLIFVRLLFEKDPIDFALSLFVLFLAIILGILLIKSTEKEDLQREGLETQSLKLKKMNSDLEWEVTERTRDLTMQKAHLAAIINSLSIGLVEYTENFQVLRMNIKAEDLLGIGRKEGKGLKFQPDRSETFDARFQTLKEVLFSDLPPDARKNREEKRFPVRGGEGSFERSEKVVIKGPLQRSIEVITFPIEQTHRKNDAKIYIKLLRDITNEEGEERSNDVRKVTDQYSDRRQDNGFEES